MAEPATPIENPLTQRLLVRRLGMVDYEPTWHAMQKFTDERGPDTPDELWLLQHPPVFTQGQAGRAEHLLAPGDIPVVQVDRGGQVTYHGPGQIVAYPLIDLRRRNLGVRALVNAIEEAVIRVLAAHGVDGRRRDDAPGVYVDGRKIASLGLRVRRGCSFHGLAFNIDLDTEPFSRINPCGFQGLEVCRLADFADITLEQAEVKLERALADTLGYNERLVAPPDSDPE
ncbi:MAG: lipoyl(octanoyl) transferase LipB [Xanthomonadales bacterium]|nr:lipoyl(octanoyl) transferase LipB [Xanthomonadales bacterium]